MNNRVRPGRGVTALLVFLLGIYAVGAYAQQSKEAELERLMLEIGVPGVQIVHLKDGQATSYNLGVKRYGAPEKVDKNTVFQAASMSKVVAAYAFLRLFDRGVFELDEPLINY